MRAMLTTTLLGLALAAPPVVAQQEEAKPRGSSGSSASSSAGRHPSSSGGAVGRSSSGDRSYSAPSSDRDRGGYRVQSGAQARHPRPGTGHGNRYPYYGRGWGRYPHYGYGNYWPWYGSYGWWGWGFYGGWGYPYYGWGGYPGYGGYGGYGYYDAEIGSLRLLVEPNKARVYVDGSYAGTVDDFDGIFQRLKLPRGRHDIALKLEGYQTHRLRVYVSPSHTLKIRWEMARGSGETFEDLTRDVAEADEAPPLRDYGAQAPPPAEARAEVAGPGTLELDVRPGDATVYIDGEFRGAAGGLARLSLPPGRHLLELVRPGYRTVQREVEIRPGKTESIAVDLERS